LNRPAELKRMQSHGGKVVGYFPGEYVREEIIHAAGAAATCFIYGGDPESVEAAHSAITHFVCPFSKAQIGYRFIGEQTYYEILDLLVAPITCQHLRRVADMYNYYTDIDVFRIGIPHEYNSEDGLKYYTEALKSLVKKIEEVTGNSITDDKLRESIVLYNKMRDLFKEIALMRKEDNPPITSEEFIKLNHASFLADPIKMIEILQSACQGLRGAKVVPKKGPRLLLIGPNLAIGDYKIPDLIQRCGGQLVAEHLDEGVRFFWTDVDTDGDPLENIARRYLQKKLPCVYMLKAYKDRLDFRLKMARDYRVDGIVCYNLKYCETADIEAFYLAQNIKEAGIPFIKLESEYDVSERGPLMTRIEAFIETLEGR